VSGVGEEDEELGAALGAGRAEADTVPFPERVLAFHSSITSPAGPRATRAWNGSTFPSMIWMPASMLDPRIASPVRGRG
jgi:hypothetical protein